MLNHLEYSLHPSPHRAAGSMKECLELEHLVDNRICCRIDVLNHVGITAITAIIAITASQEDHE
jgi:hypothetical protein